jgi:predicted DCC family thiol-disulfide oxidoreductase YuxK
VLTPLAIQDPAGDALLAGMDEEAKLGSWHFVDDDGRVVSGGQAFAPVLARLPAGLALRRLADVAYGVVADHRSLWGRLITDAARQRARDRIAARRR